MSKDFENYLKRKNKAHIDIIGEDDFMENKVLLLKKYVRWLLTGKMNSMRIMQC